MLTATRRAATSKIEYFIAIFEMVFLFSGAAASMLFGKLLLALVFFAIAPGSVDVLFTDRVSSERRLMQGERHAV